MAKSLASKLVFLICSLLGVTVLASGLLVFVKSNDIILKQTEQHIRDLNQGEANIISNLVRAEWSKSSLLASRSEFIRLVSEESGLTNNPSLANQANMDLKDFVERSGNLEHAFIVNRKGIIVADSDEHLIGADINDRNYTKQSLSTGKETVSETLISKSTGEQIVVFTEPIRKNNQLLGFVGSAVYLKSFSQYLADIRVSDTPSSYAYMVDSKGTMLYHPTKAKVGKPVENAQIQEVVKTLQTGSKVQPAVTSYLFNGSKKFAGYTVIPETQWILVLSADYGEIFAPLQAMNLYNLGVGLLALVIASLLGFFFIKKLTSPLGSLTKLIERTSDLDLVVNTEYYKTLNSRQDEIGTMAKTMAKMRLSLQDMAKGLISSTSDIHHNALDLQEIANQVEDNSSESLSVIQELSAGMEETAAAAEEISASAEEVKRNVADIAFKAREGSAFTQEITQKANRLKMDTESSSEKANILYIEAKEKMQKALDQAKTINQINVLAESILTIAGQTNLLALNAAIEAARAGESGRGFSVVANEIKKLADQSSQTVGDIQKMVNFVTNSVGQMTESAENLLSFIDKSIKEDYVKFIQASMEYYRDAESIQVLMSDFNSTAENLDMTMTHVSTAIQEVATTVGEGATGVQEIASKTNEIFNHAQNVGNSAKDNLTSVKDLMDITSKFVLSDD
jgi:methyl-accepting chemotaxis protein